MCHTQQSPVALVNPAGFVLGDRHCLLLRFTDRWHLSFSSQKARSIELGERNRSVVRRMDPELVGGTHESWLTEEEEARIVARSPLMIYNPVWMR